MIAIHPDNPHERISVLELIRDTHSSCDFGEASSYDSEYDFWSEVLTRKAWDTGFGHLVESLLTQGWDENSAIGLYQIAPGEWRITEGHHRIVAAILLGMEEIPYSPYGKNSLGEGPAANFGKKVCAHGCSADPYPFLLEV